MRPVEPRVLLVAQTRPDYGQLLAYLTPIGGHEWWDRMSDHLADEDIDTASYLTEFAGRLCYKAWKEKLNPNVTRIRTDTREYIENVLKQGHGSVFEHFTATFLFENVSRVFTHELVRHRVGGFSQESLRFVRLTNLGFWYPKVFQLDGDVDRRSEVYEMGNRLLRQMEEFQERLAELYELDKEGTNFAYKKQVTSAMRRFAPIGLATNILWTTNLRNLRHVLTMRTEEGAEEEMRLVFDLVGAMAQREWPNIFQDFTRSDSGVWVPKYRKV